jgi:hypothetical protein
MNTFFKPPLCLLLLLFQGLMLGTLIAQSDTLSISTKSTKLKMNSHLNGSTRNHEHGYTTKSWAENKFDDKVDLYKNIKNNYANNGKMLYRVGHNITDGNFDYSPLGFDYKSPGWHWATEYGDGFDAEYIAQLQSTNNPLGLGIHNDLPSLTTRMGAGVRRFMFVNDPDHNGCTANTFSGFAVTVNYKNTITLNLKYLPKSQTVYLDSTSTYICDSYWNQDSMKVIDPTPAQSLQFQIMNQW